MEPGTQMGPLVSDEQFRRVTGYLDSGKEAGATAVTGGGRHSEAHALAKKIRSGTVWINGYNVFDASLPAGGYKQSGWGRGDGPRGPEQLHRGEGRHRTAVTRRRVRVVIWGDRYGAAGPARPDTADAGNGGQPAARRSRLGI
jgi:acyl-CoA reductase-like NAD-dependent aldehyde dehydrogenase